MKPQIFIMWYPWQQTKKLVLIYHGESIFNTNKGQPWTWATEDTPIIQPNTKGSGVMVRGFVDQDRGLPQLLDEKHVNISAEEPDFPLHCVLFEYRAGKEGCGTGDKFMNNVKNAVKIAEHATHTIQLPQSSCRGFIECSSYECFPGGQSRMHDMMCGRRVQKMVMEDGIEQKVLRWCWRNS